jgi:hypothetical protein
MAVELEGFLKERLDRLNLTDPARPLYERFLSEVEDHLATRVGDDPLAMARLRLESLVADLRPLKVSGPTFKQNWQHIAINEEIKRYGDRSVVYLVPPVAHYHGKILTTFRGNNIHSKDQVANLTNEQINDLRNTTGVNLGVKTREVIAAIRDLAVAQLDQEKQAS